MTPIAAWARRVGLSYLLIYNAGFPLEVLGIAPLAEGFSQGEQWLVRTATRLVTGIDVALTITGSGDTLYHYCEMALHVLLALVGATVWHLWTRGAPVSPRTRDLVTVLVRYVLASTMLTYGWIKLIPVQMPAPGP